MRILMGIGLLAVFLIPVSATAQNPFDGTWKINLNNAKLPEKPDVYVVQNGMYDCQSCVPPFKIKADGQDQKVSGHPYFDTMIITIVDDHSIEQSTKKDGKVNSTSKWTVSADGNTMTQTFSDSSASNGDPVTGKADATRVAKGPAGSHTVSGSWRTGKVDSVSDNGLLFSYKVDGDTLSMTTPTGQSYTAKLDGTDAPFQGDPGISSVSLRRTSKNSIEETDKRDGKVISISVMTISPDGKSMTIANTDKLHSTTSQFVADKQ